MTGAGNSNTVVQYSFPDNEPYALTFYRLKQIDFDGKYSYSNIITVKCEDTQQDVFNVQQAENDFILTLPHVAESSLKISIYNITGQIVFKKELYSPDNNSNEIRLSGISLNQAVYLFRLQYNNETFSQKLFVH